MKEKTPMTNIWCRNSDGRGHLYWICGTIIVDKIRNRWRYRKMHASSWIGAYNKEEDAKTAAFEVGGILR